MVIADPKNPYVSYTVKQLFDFLASYALPRPIGAQYEYSNLGVGLLGQALSFRAGREYEALVSERVLRPLGMRDTRIVLPADMQRRLAPGHDDAGKVARLWDFTTLAGAGALRSTVNDMLIYVRANADSISVPLGRVLATTHVQRRPGPTANLSIGLAWHRLRTPSGRTIVWHNGGTGGYRTFAGYEEASGLGVVVLANSAVSVDDIGMHLLDASMPLAPIPARRMAITLTPAVLDRLLGEYEIAPTFTITITREGTLLYAQATGQGRLPLLAENDSTFFLTSVDAQVTFTRDAGGAVTGMVLQQNGQNIPGRKKQAR
jgi:CubicO group peptidase (beta-lactamase class C family)